jgi:hypothetical protein
MYTLNLLFDFDETNGRFSGDATTASGTLNTSMNWLRLKKIENEPPDPNPPAFDPERNAIWDNLTEAKATLLVSHKAQRRTLCVRVAPDPDKPSPPGDLKLRLVVCFGRPTKARQPQSSPFTQAQDGAVLTTFVTDPIPMNSPNGLNQDGTAKPGNVAWFFPLGKMNPKELPQDENKTHRYEFALGVIASSVSANKTRYYGEDPEIDIGD